MPDRRPSGEPRGEGRSVRRIAALAAAVVAVALAVAVFFVVSGGSGDGATPSPRDAASPGVETPGVETPGVEPSAQLAGTDRFLVDLADTGFALRARTGRCPAGGGTLEQSGDGGQTWTAPEIAADITAVQAVRARDGLVLGSSESCVPQAWVTADAGASWQERDEDDGDAAVWARGADPAAPVLAPAGAVAGPCLEGEAPVSVTEDAEGTGVVACSDGLVSRSFDGGSSWRAFGRVPGVTAVSFDGDIGYAAAATPDCGGTAVWRGQSGRWAELACVAFAQPRGAALTVRGDTGLLVGYAGTWRSADAGSTWTATG